MKLREYMRINVWLLPIVIIIIPIIMILFGSSYLTTPHDFYFAQLDSNWSVKCGDLETEGPRLSDINLGHLKKGDTLVLSTYLPKEPVPSGALMFRSLLSTVSVKIDEKLVYEYGQDYFEKGLMIPKHYNFVPIYKTDASHGRKVEITFVIAEDNAFSGISPIYYGNRHEIERFFVQKNRLTMFIGVFLCMFALVIFTLSSYLYIYHGRDLSLLFSSFISVFFGGYCLSYADIYNFFANRDGFFTVLEYVTLYSIPLSIIAFLVTSHPELNSRVEKVMLTINTAFPIITFALHLLNIVHINKFVTTLHVIAITEAIITIPKLVKNMIKKYKQFHEELGFTGMTSDSILLLGLIIFITTAVGDILKYNFFRHFEAGGEVYSDINFVCIGALCFVMCLFVYYFFHGIEHINDVRTREHLEGLAYTDALTGLMNRAKCMQYMAQISGKYAVISLDLDNLKTVNDTLGHIEGDRMIKAFAEILKHAFAGAALIGRTGGDEFMVVVENPSEDTCEIMLQNMEEKIAAFNQNDKVINISTSYGYASSEETKSHKAEDVFMLADERMYVVKEEHHKIKMDRFMSDLFESVTGKGGKKKE